MFLFLSLCESDFITNFGFQSFDAPSSSAQMKLVIVLQLNSSHHHQKSRIEIIHEEIIYCCLSHFTLPLNVVYLYLNKTYLLAMPY